MTCSTSINCDHSETCIKTSCPGHPSQPQNQWGAGHPLPLHRQVMPPEPTEQEGHTLGLWLVYGVSLAIFLSFVLMTWVVYPNFPQ